MLYDEPKRLVRLGLATVREEPAGQRTRAVYEITDDGRRALEAWLATEPTAPRFEFETMLRLIYADQGPKEDTLGAVRAARHWATARAAEGLGQLRGYLADGGPFPDRLHISVLFARFYGDLFELIVRWADLAEEHIGQWPRTDGLGLTGPTRELLEELVTRMEALTAAEPAGSDAPNENGPRRCGLAGRRTACWFTGEFADWRANSWFASIRLRALGTAVCAVRIAGACRGPFESSMGR